MIPVALKRTVCFLGNRRPDGGLDFKGTAFVVSMASEFDENLGHVYLVTARHCVEQARKEADPVLRFNVRSSVEVRKAETDPESHYHWIPGESKTVPLPSSWLFPDDASDVGVTTDVQLDDADWDFINESLLIRYQDLENETGGIGSELVIVGLCPWMQGHVRNTPIVRTGIISALPEERFTADSGEDYVAYLAEIRSIGGLSGSPVFVRHRPNDLLPMQKHFVGGHRYHYRLAGLICGHFDLKMGVSTDFGSQQGQLLNSGLALVTPSDAILDLLASEECKQERKESVRLRHAES